MVTPDQLVSVVIPTHNRAALLPRAIESVQRQTYPHLEIIVVDDGSTDDTPAAVESLGDQRIRYVRHDINRGQSAARNIGIHLATGAFIGFLDSDAVWKPETVARQLSLLDRYDAVLCTRLGQTGDRYRRKERVTLEDLRRGRFIAGGTSILMARADVLRDTLFDETLRFSEDRDLIIRLAQKYSVGYLNEPLVREMEGSRPRVTSGMRGMSVRERENACQGIRKHEHFFGPKWFRRHMRDKLLSAVGEGSATPKWKMTLILYTARRYGAINVVWWLGKFFLARKRDGLRRLMRRFGQ